jgi:hypothetical protein
MFRDAPVTTERGIAMSTLYENEYQVQSVIAKYHREAANANRVDSSADREDRLITRAADAVTQRLQAFVHGTRVLSRPTHDASPAHGSPTTFLHFPK